MEHQAPRDKSAPSSSACALISRATARRCAKARRLLNSPHHAQDNAIAVAHMLRSAAGRRLYWGARPGGLQDGPGLRQGHRAVLRCQSAVRDQLGSSRQLVQGRTESSHGRERGGQGYMESRIVIEHGQLPSRLVEQRQSFRVRELERDARLDVDKQRPESIRPLHSAGQQLPRLQ
jgi:hypothetical protein